MIGFVLAPFYAIYNLTYWLRMRAKRRRQRAAKVIDQSGNPIRYIPAASFLFSIISLVAALLAGATLGVILLPAFAIAGIAIVLALLAKALARR